MSKHFEAKKTEVLQIREFETDQNVLQWIDEYVRDLDARITEARISEERGRL